MSCASTTPIRALSLPTCRAISLSCSFKMLLRRFNHAAGKQKLKANQSLMLSNVWRDFGWSFPHAETATQPKLLRLRLLPSDEVYPLVKSDYDCKIWVGRQM